MRMKREASIEMPGNGNGTSKRGNGSSPSGANSARGESSPSGATSARGTQSPSGANSSAVNVDMMAQARNAQWTPDAFLGDGAIKALSPAKVNLFLAVGKKRQDGYHDVVTVMHALALHDVLYLNRTEGFDASDAAKAAESDAAALAGPSSNLLITITMAEKSVTLGDSLAEPLDIPVRDNLVFKAVDALARDIGYDKQERILIHIEKSIPMQAGLGGGSSNAAAALVALSQLWGLPGDGPSVSHVAASLGADVEFFLHGGCAVMTGIGDALERTIEPFSHPAVIVKPDSGVNTASAYAAFDADPDQVDAGLIAMVENVASAADVPLCNNLTEAASSVNPDVRGAIVWLKGTCGLEPLLCGSGSAVIAITGTFAEAMNAATAARSMGYWSRATTFSKIRCAVMPKAQR